MQCLSCSKETKNHKYCSQSCANRHNNIGKPKKKLTKKCKVCEKLIYSNQSYCSKECRESTYIKIAPGDYQENTYCPICKELRTRENSLTNTGKQIKSYCKKCKTHKSITKCKQFKAQCLEYKGRCCSVCGYDKCQAALEFHHRNPSEKDFNIKYRGTYRFNETIKNELDKCDLLCANCHREEHTRLNLNTEK